MERVRTYRCTGWHPRAAYTISGEESQDLTIMSTAHRSSCQQKALHTYLPYAWSKLNHHQHRYLSGHSSPDFSCKGTREYMHGMSRFLPTSGTLVDRGFMVHAPYASANEGHAAIRSHLAHCMLLTERLRDFDLQILWGLPAGCVIASHCPSCFCTYILYE